MTPPFAAIGLSALLVASGAAAQVRASHHLRFAIGDQKATVEVTVTGITGVGLWVAMPAWRPGFRPGVISDHPPSGWRLQARSGKQELPILPRGRGNWAVATSGVDTLTLRYELPIAGRDVGLGLGERRPHEFAKDGKPATIRYHQTLVLRPGATWLEVVGAENVIQLTLPEGFATHGPLPRGSYSELLGAPIYIGETEHLTFDLDGEPHELFLAGFARYQTDRKEFTDWLRTLLQQNVRALGAPPQKGYRILVGRAAGPPHGVGFGSSAEIAYHQLRPTPTLARLVAEAHLARWDGTHFHPAERDGIREPTLTREAWFWLGAREYLTELAVVRAEVETPKAFWTHTVATRINRVQLDDARLETSIAATGDRMRRADRAPKPPAPHPRVVGFLLCLLLDVELRTMTNGQKSLESLLRALMEQTAARKKGYTNADIRAVAASVAGRDLDHVLSCVTTAKELPLTGILAKVGVDAQPMTQAPRKDPKDKRLPKARRRPARWRVTLAPEPTKTALTHRAALTKPITKGR